MKAKIYNREMNNKTKVRLGLNLGLTVIYTYINSRALATGLEETFVTYALMFGLVVTIANLGLDRWRDKNDR